MALIQNPISSGNSTGYEADLVDLAPEDTVESRVAGLIAKNSPIQQQARTRANQASNSKGLLNTSMAVGDAQKAVYDYAVPIASKDAETSFQSKLANQNAKNTFKLNQQQGDIESDLMGERFGYESQSREQAANIDSRLLGEQTGYQSQLMAEKAQIDRDLQSAEGQIRQDLMNREAMINKEMAQLQANLQEARDATLNDFQSQQNEIERQFQADQNEAQRDLAREELLRNSASELMRQVSGQNATLMDAIGQINSADLLLGDKTALIRKMSELHLNNLETTTAMSDFDIVDGEVVYSSGGSGESGSSSPSNQLPDSSSQSGLAVPLDYYGVSNNYGRPYQY